MSEHDAQMRELRERVARIRRNLDVLNREGEVTRAKWAARDQATQSRCLELRRKIVDPRMMALSTKLNSNGQLRHEALATGGLRTEFEKAAPVPASTFIFTTEIRILPATGSIELMVYVSHCGRRITTDGQRVAESEVQAILDLESMLQRCVEAYETQAQAGE